MSREEKDTTLLQLERLLQLLIDRTANGAARWGTRNTGLDTRLVFNLSTPNFTVRLEGSETFGHSVRIVDETGNVVIELSGFHSVEKQQKALDLLAKLFSTVKEKTIHTGRHLDRIIADIEKL